MRDLRPNLTPAVSPNFSDAPRREVQSPPSMKWDPADRHDIHSPKPGLSLPFDGTAVRAAHIVGWAAAPGVVSASLESTANGGVSCTMWVRTADGEQPVPSGKCLSRGADRVFSVEDVEESAAMAELRRLCAGVDPFASIAQATPRPSTRDT